MTSAKKEVTCNCSACSSSLVRAQNLGLRTPEVGNRKRTYDQRESCYMTDCVPVFVVVRGAAMRPANICRNSPGQNP